MDAKAWLDESGIDWYAMHTDCPDPEAHKLGGTLSEVLRGVEECADAEYFWEIRHYPDGASWLLGFTNPRETHDKP